MLFYQLLKPLLILGYKAYYQKIWILNQAQVPKSEAVILVANHSNTFIDPTIMATFQSRDLHFWARANEFKKPFLGWLARNVHILPVFRIQDGRENMSKNNTTFELSRDLLNKKGLLFIAPEGGCELERRLRDLKAGAAKLAYSFLKENPTRKLYFLPTGLNYSDLINSSAEAYVSFGQSFLANDYFTANESDFINAITDKIQEGIKSQMLHIDKPENDNYMMKIWEIWRNNRDYKLLKSNEIPFLFKNLQNIFVNTQQLEHFDQQQLFTNIDNYFALLAKNNLKDIAIIAADKISIFAFLGLGFINLMIFTNYLIHFLPIFLVRKLLKSLVKDLAFRASVALVAGIFITLFYYILISIIAAIFIGFYAVIIPICLYLFYAINFKLANIKKTLEQVVKYKRWRVKNDADNKKLVELRQIINSSLQ